MENIGRNPTPVTCHYSGAFFDPDRKNIFWSGCFRVTQQSFYSEQPFLLDVCVDINCTLSIKDIQMHHIVDCILGNFTGVCSGSCSDNVLHALYEFLLFCFCSNALWLFWGLETSTSFRTYCANDLAACKKKPSNSTPPRHSIATTTEWCVGWHFAIYALKS